MRPQNLLLVALVLAVATAFSQPVQTGPDPQMKGKLIINVDKGDQVKTIDIHLANLQKERTQIALQHVNSDLVYSEWVWGEHGFAKKINLNGMPEGEYVLFVRNKNIAYAQAIAMDDEDLALFKTPQTEAGDIPGVALVSYSSFNRKGRLIARFNVEDKGVLGLRLANLRGEPALVRLNNMGMGLVMEQRIDAKYGFAQKMNLEGMTPATYYLYIQTPDAVVMQFMTYTDKGDLILNGTQRLDWRTVGARRKLAAK